MGADAVADALRPQPAVPKRGRPVPRPPLSAPEAGTGQGAIDGGTIARAAAVGVAAGLLASFAMDRFQAAITALSSSDTDAEPATDRAADRATRLVTGHGLSTTAKPLGGQVVHYALGAGLGAFYSVAAEHRRDITAGYGAAFGIGVAVVLDTAAVPAAGLGKPPWDTGLRTHSYAMASHIVFGGVTELARRTLTAMLRGSDAAAPAQPS